MIRMGLCVKAQCSERFTNGHHVAFRSRSGGTGKREAALSQMILCAAIAQQCPSCAGNSHAKNRET
jgi:hypothetical protein